MHCRTFNSTPALVPPDVSSNTPQAVATKTHLNIAKCSPGDKITVREPDTGQMLITIKGVETVVTSPDWGGGLHTSVFVGEQKGLKGKEQTSTFVYLHRFVQFVGKEERLVLDTLNW